LANLTADASGNLYGTAYSCSLNSFGCVFKLTRSGSSFTYSDLYEFTGGADGSNPVSNVVLDASGNLYGTTYLGGSHNLGTVWQLVP
jgi:hypothetical protein